MTVHIRSRPSPVLPSRGSIFNRVLLSWTRCPELLSQGAASSEITGFAVEPHPHLGAVEKSAGRARSVKQGAPVLSPPMLL
jgi:hypothetical protein